MRSTIVVAALVGLCHASPLEERTIPTGAAFCSAVTSLVSKAKATSTASKFCSSYLSISTTTVTAVSTVSTTASISTVTATTGTTVATASAPVGITTLYMFVTIPYESWLTTQQYKHCLYPYTVSSVTTVPVIGTTTVNVIATSTVTPATQFATFDVTATVVGTTVFQQTTITSYTATVTNTVTQTHTYDAFAAAPTFSTFNIRANVVGNPSNAANGDYGVFNDQQSWVAFTATDASSATVFTLDSSCHLSVNGGAKYAASNIYGNEGAIVVFIGPGNGGLSGSPNTYAACGIILDPTVDTGLRLRCNRNGGTYQAVANDNSGLWYAGGSVSSSSDAAKIVVVPVA
ncbi:hypothetical protein LTR95_014245 [Oleoguttula sp. CCFEE 5521]